MSDYLWDKTGEPDAETERLENLLGQLRFQPTPFDLPAELPAREPRTIRATRNVLSWPRLALAASLTLAALAGAWLMLRQQSGTTDSAPVIAQQSEQPGAGVTRPGVAPQANSDGNAGGAEEKVEKAAVVPSQGGETRRDELSAGGQRPRLPDLDTPRRTRQAVAPRANRGEQVRAPRRQKNRATPDVENVRREELARAAAEREAAEKVLYALRITSEKLNYARQQVREAARGEDNR